MSVRKGFVQADEIISDWLSDGNSGSCLDIAKALDIKKVTVYSALMRLQARGEAKVIDEVPGLKAQMVHIWGAKREVNRSTEGMVRKAIASQPPLVMAWNDYQAREAV